jgi:hypothetical protein
MLRRPSACLTARREEGCSSTAFDLPATNGVPVWNNPTVRGSGPPLVAGRSAVP